LSSYISCGFFDLDSGFSFQRNEPIGQDLLCQEDPIIPALQATNSSQMLSVTLELSLQVEDPDDFQSFCEVKRIVSKNTSFCFLLRYPPYGENTFSLE